jgi:cytochrome b involved in lipid metabolism
LKIFETLLHEKILSFVIFNPDMPSITHEQVAAHNTKADLYMIIHNKVYNISEFVDEVT